MDDRQLDLFDDFEEARVYSCIAGAFVGKIAVNGDEPVMRLSDYYRDIAAARSALASGVWAVPKPDETKTVDDALHDEFHRVLLICGNDKKCRPASSEEVIDAAMSEMQKRFSRGQRLSSPADTQRFLQLKLSHLEHEVFAVLWLDNCHRVLAFEELFRGTIDGASVHPREVVKSALQHNAAACIFVHNHPSGDATPSQADRNITERLKDALRLIDVRTLDHMIVAENTYSFVQHGSL